MYQKKIRTIRVLTHEGKTVMLSVKELNSFGFLIPLVETSRKKNSPIWAARKPDRSRSWTESLPPQQNKFASMIIFQGGRKILQKLSRGINGAIIDKQSPQR